MKTLALICLITGTFYLSSCGSNDATTQMPAGGYKERTDSSTTGDSITDPKDKGAVAVDTVKNGQAVISGATSDSSKK